MKHDTKLAELARKAQLHSLRQLPGKSMGPEVNILRSHAPRTPKYSPPTFSTQSTQQPFGSLIRNRM